MIQIDLHRTLDAQGGKLELSFQADLLRGQIVSIFGPSGAGKTSILKMLAGLMLPDQGSLVVNQTPWYDTKTKVNLPAQKRSIGYVFQENALFPNMSARKNLEFGLQGRNPQLINELLEVIELSDLQDRRPAFLSGGQQQRLALARAMVRKPELLLLDEPFSALDSKMRIRIQEYLMSLHKVYSPCIVLVSHDVGEVYKLSDHVFVLENGSIIREGEPAVVFGRKQVSGKFQFSGEVIKIQQEEVVFIVSVLIGSTITKVVADSSEVANLAPGDKVLVASKAFNPLIQKIDE